MKDISLPKISVVTIVLNDLEGFLVTAKSIFNQDYRNIEWIVIDGNSTDGTAECIKKMSPSITQYKIENDTGIYNAMNKGIDMVTGDWVFFMNADDAFYHSKTVSFYVSCLKEDDDIVYSDAMRKEDGKINTYRSADLYWAGMYFDHQTSCVRSEVYKKLKYDESFKISGDFNFFSLARVKGYNFRKLDGVIGCIKPFTTGLSANYLERQIERITVLRRHFESKKNLKFLEDEYSAAYKKKVISKDELDILLTHIS